MTLARNVGLIFRRASAYGSFVSKSQSHYNPFTCFSFKFSQDLSLQSARCFSASSAKFGDLPGNLRYSEEHEWIDSDGSVAKIGITDHAQGQLGDLVYIETPEVGTTVEKSDETGSVESVKSVASLYAPVSGEIVEVNGKLEDHPEYVNDSPYTDGWILKIKMSNPSEVDDLLTAEQYKKLIEEEA